LYHSTPGLRVITKKKTCTTRDAGVEALGAVEGDPALRAGSNRLFQFPGLDRSSSKSGDFWYNRVYRDAGVEALGAEEGEDVRF